MSSQSIPKLLKLKDYITLIGTTLGIIALVCACIGHPALLSLGFFLVTVSLGTDMVDGYIARKTQTVNEMGKEMDSLSDSLTFGIAPAILVYQSFKTNTFFDIVIVFGSICFAIGAILRLARFNISENPGYTGVPTPISALVIVTFFYANYFFSFAAGTFYIFSPYLIPVIMILVGWFNITTYIHFGEKDKATYLLFIIVAPLCPIFGIIGLSSPNDIISIIVSIFFIVSFLSLMIAIIRGFFLYFRYKNKNNHTIT